MMAFGDQVQSCHAERSEESEVPSHGFFASLGMTGAMVATKVHIHNNYTSCESRSQRSDTGR